jgi:hypothetical protein
MSRIAPREPAAVELRSSRSLADLLWVANTRHGPGGHWFARPAPDDPEHDHLESGGDAVTYLADHGVDVPAAQPTPAELDDLVVIREMVRGLGDGWGGWTPAGRSLLDRTMFHLDVDAVLTADGGAWRGLIGDLLSTFVTLIRQRDRLAMCGNPACRLVFIDGSKSGTRRWCDDGGCGNRVRTRRHRARHPVTH